jgi:actin-related protein 8
MGFGKIHPLNITFLRMPTEDAVDIQLKASTVPVIANLTSASRYVQTYFLSTDSIGSRRPVLDGDKTVVIQPGSRFLKIGFAKDAFPKIIPHVVAYKSRAMDVDTDGDDEEEEWELGEDELKEHLAARHKSLKRKPPPNVYQSLISYNRSVEPQQISQHNDAFAFDWIECPAGQSVFVGKEALRLDPVEGYALRWPIRRGTIDRLAYRSYREAIGDMGRIWAHILRHQLAIKGPLDSYSAMIVLPGDVSRWEIRAYTELALNLLGMGAVSFILEPVAATFGAGVSGACVVDIGAQCISVGCVEEGLLLPDALVKLDYGGDDLTRLLHNILKHHNFPYQIPLGFKDPLDFELLNDLRVNLCTLDEEDVGVGAQVYEFFVRRPGKTTLQYHFKVFEERMLPILVTPC